MNILCIGDIFGKPGREALAARLASLIERYAVDFTIVNWENAAGGRGVTPDVARDLLALPVDVFTSGNHIWQHAALAPLLADPRVLRPHNAPAGRPGKGVGMYAARNGTSVGVINMQGRAHMYEEKLLANPFLMVEPLLEQMRRDTRIICIDLHAEVTSEKRAMGWWVDGKASCLFGTHTHVQTADEQILPRGTAYITDLGMTGPHASVLGARAEDAIKRFLSDGREKSWKPATGGVRIEGIVVEIDPDSGRSRRIERFQEPFDSAAHL
ncbi:MAG: YmdB family metallophosphoesterase [Deltaproteobacteria bacterium]|nr:YmdB family metallophosphoesterase [Deltaproteobacteria bacterium]